MIQYISTRGDKKLHSFSEVILKGLAQDGGLFVPKTIPHFSHEQLEKLQYSSFAQKALFVLNLFQTDFSRNTLQTITERAYGTKSNFDTQEISPVKHIRENEYLLELFHGPTLAFKDMALQMMPLLFSEAVKMSDNKTYLILVATSGDTGKAALEGYKNKEHIFVIVFFPDKRVSSIQALSMITQEGSNLAVYPVYGNFDDTQRLVKNIFTDKNFHEKLYDSYGVTLSAANSINWGRLSPQIVYHISGYLDLVRKNYIRLGDEIDVAIPSGNFGNMLTAYIARQMGLPIRKFICASNENNILTDFLRTGIFDLRKRSLVPTFSPAMDILTPSSIERLLYFITRDTKQVGYWIDALQTKKIFTVNKETTEHLQNLFYADWVSNADCMRTIQKTFDETGYLIDPHTAVVKEVVNRYKKQQKEQIPILIYSTAHWAKFPETVYRSFFGEKQIANEFEMIEKIHTHTKSSIPKKILELQKMPILHTEKLDPNEATVEEMIMDKLKAFGVK